MLYDSMGGVRLDNARHLAEAQGYDWDEAIIRKLIALAAAMQEG